MVGAPCSKFIFEHINNGIENYIMFGKSLHRNDKTNMTVCYCLDTKILYRMLASVVVDVTRTRVGLIVY